MKLLSGFESMNDYFNRDNVIAGIVEIVQDATIYEDDGFLEVLREMHSRGILEKYEDLVVKARAYF